VIKRSSYKIKETALASADAFEPIKINKYGSDVYVCPVCDSQYNTRNVFMRGIVQINIEILYVL